ncbi:hypothetical protein K431DRAFT_281358 [Polychaeton citri CBS 116435]|uniref:Uncharacterized protein n=1 Tax=Polychaeton citri CBS 116435 TaxID=1314669 RepID=A0A9P4QHJ3_9PEZI|nr:hypothetical protein K431DRAFT_281358 [Polychaeton citri CBS 116435]
MPTTPAYSIQRDPPWVPGRVSTAPTASSIYSDDSDTPYHEFAAVPMMPAELNITKGPKGPKPQYSISGFPHPKQQITDPGPDSQRQSRLPIFKQVRGLLAKPLPPLVTSPQANWDEFSGEPSDFGKPRLGQIPSTYAGPYDSAVRNRGTARRPSPSKLRSRSSKRSLSPVSMLRDSEIYEDSEDEIKPVAPLKASERKTVSPVSPVTMSPVSIKLPTPQSTGNVQGGVPPTEPSPSVQAIKRKPVSRVVSTVEHTPAPVPRPQRPNSLESWEDFDEGDRTPVVEDKDQRDPTSHFSWTTYATSQAPDRTSSDTYATKFSQPVKEIEPLRSRFSWSTVNTNTNTNAAGSIQIPQHEREPLPPIPQQYQQPGSQTQLQPKEPPYRVSEIPVQSILSRKRPVQRSDQEDRSPTSHLAAQTTPGAGHGAPRPTPANLIVTPISTGRSRASPISQLPPTPVSASTLSSDKKLPLPPELQQPSSLWGQLTHLEMLQAQEKDIVLQRRNVEKAIDSCSKLIHASPLHVSFSNVRDGKKKLQDYESRLAEVLLEERELGVKISRARRKEGAEEGLWVRRVTG